MQASDQIVCKQHRPRHTYTRFVPNLVATVMNLFNSPFSSRLLDNLLLISLVIMVLVDIKLGSCMDHESSAQFLHIFCFSVGLAGPDFAIRESSYVQYYSMPICSLVVLSSWCRP